MKIISVAIIFLFFSFYAIYGQKEVVQVKVDNTSYCVDSFTFSLVTFEYKNISKENILLWIDKNNVKTLTLEQKIKSYFFNRKGEFALIDIMYEDLINGFTPLLFTTFVKKLAPEESFTFNILYDTKLVKESIDQLQVAFNERMVFVLTSALNKFMNIKFLDNINYKGNNLSIQSKYLFPLSLADSSNTK